MRLSVAALAASLVVALGGCNRAPGYPPTAPIRPENVVDFATLYGQNCEGCHGAAGENGPAMDLANPEYQALIDDATMRKWISNGMPDTLMPAFAQSAGGMLTDKQIDAVVSGMRKMWQKPNALAGASAPPYTQAAAGNAERGKELYGSRCGICHSGSAQDITSSTYLALVSDQALRTMIVAGRPDIGQPDWRHDSKGGKPAAPLTAQEVDDIVTYLSTLRNPAQASAQPAAAAKPGR